MQFFFIANESAEGIVLKYMHLVLIVVPSRSLHPIISTELLLFVVKPQDAVDLSVIAQGIVYYRLSSSIIDSIILYKKMYYWYCSLSLIDVVRTM